MEISDRIEELRRAVAWRWRLAQFVGVALVVTMVIITPVAMFVLSVLAALELGPGIAFVSRADTASHPSDLLVLVVTAYATFFLLPFLLLLPACYPIVRRWVRPPRIVVFRKFNVRRFNRPLRRLVRRDVARYGHVFTLADAGFKVPFYVRIPFLIGQLNIFQFRQRQVRDRRGLTALGHAIRERGWLSLNWLMARDKAFAIASTDAFWRECVDALLEGAQLIVFDMSMYNTSLDWEMRRCERSGLLPSTLVVCLAQSEAEVRNRLLDIQARTGVRVPLFTYDSAGKLADPAGFSDAALRVLAEQRPATTDPSLALLTRRIGWSLSAIALAAAVACFCMSPWVFPRFVLDHSPLSWQIMPAYLLAGQDSDIPRLYAFRRKAMNAMLDHAALGNGRASGTLPSLAEACDIPALVRLVETEASDALLGGTAACGAFKALQAVRAPDLDLYAARWIPSPVAQLHGFGMAVLRSSFSTRMVEPLLVGLPRMPRYEDEEELDLVLRNHLDPKYHDLYLAGLSGNPWFAALCGRALAATLEPAAVPALLAGLRLDRVRRVLFDFFPRREAPDYRPAIAQALASLAAARVVTRVPPLAPFLSGDDAAARIAARFALLSVDEPGWDATLSGLQAPQALLEEWLKEVSVPDQSARLRERLRRGASWLKTQLETKEPRVQLSAARLLARIGDPAGVKVAVTLAGVRDNSGLLHAAFGGYSLPYEKDARAVLEDLYANMSPGQDPAWFEIEVPDGVDLRGILRSLQLKAQGTKAEYGPLDQVGPARERQASEGASRR